MTPTVFIGKALICFASQCFPVLTGADTPIGEYPLIQRITNQDGYEGDVLQFLEKTDRVYAVHRVWGPDKKRRMRILSSANPADKTIITKGCINVDSAVYSELTKYNKIIIKE